MNRVAITLDENGDITNVASDEAIQFFFVSPHTPHDRVYLYRSVTVGPEHVQAKIGGYPVGHFHDELMGGTEQRYPPSFPMSF